MEGIRKYVWMERNTSCPSLQSPQSLLGHWTISHLDLGAESYRWGEKARECTTASLPDFPVHHGRYTERGFTISNLSPERVIKKFLVLVIWLNAKEALRIWMTPTEERFHCGWRTGTLGCWPDSKAGAIPADLWPLGACILSCAWLYTCIYHTFWTLTLTMSKHI